MVDRQDAYTLHRYFVWSNRMDSLALRLRKPNEPFLDKVALVQFSTYFGYWLAGLYVVVEGWRELGFSDETVDGLLAESELVERLRRFRNGMFHFQRNYDDPRFLDLLSDPDAILPWAKKLQRAFGDWFLKELIEPTGIISRSDSSFEIDDPASGSSYRIDFSEESTNSVVSRLLKRIRRLLAG